MKPGDLRRFNDKLVNLAHEEDCSGHVFMVLKVDVARGGVLLVDVLMDGRIEKEWGHQWVKDNSEALDETR